MIRLFDDAESLSRAAADLFVEQASRAVQARGRFTVALSGGRTPRRTYALLAADPRREKTSWPDVHVFWGDERCVPPDDPRSNARMAWKTLLDHVPVRWGQIHPIDGETVPDAAADAYERLLRRELADSGGRLDLVFLGLGEDGHTASLFPGRPLPADGARWVAAVPADGRETDRVTMTPGLINAARMVVFLVMGRAKASILDAVVGDTADPRQLPARLIRPHPGRLIWMVDRKAASNLLQSKQRRNGDPD